MLLAILIAFYFLNFSSFTWDSVSKNQSDWAAFGSYLGGVSTFVALIFAICSVKEWRKEKVFGKKLAAVEKLFLVYIKSVEFIEYTHAYSSELTRLNPDDDNDRLNSIKYGQKFSELRENYVQLYACINASYVSIRAIDKNYQSYKNILGLMNNLVTICNVENASKDSDKIFDLRNDIKSSIEAAINELTNSSNNELLLTEFDSLRTNINHF